MSNLIQAVETDVEKLYKLLNGIVLEKLTGDLDGVAVKVTDYRINWAQSLQLRTLVGEFDYEDAAGVTHTATFTTQQKNDGSDTLVIDGTVEGSAVVDLDLMGKPLKLEVELQVQFRFTDAAAVAHQLQFKTGVGFLAGLGI